jgi:hypothetical protein
VSPEPYAGVMLRLLQGAIEFDDRKDWEALNLHEKIVRSEFAKLGLELVFSPNDGYAFLRQPELESETSEAPALPRLISRHKLSREVTILCILLRERLDQFENSTPDSDRLLLSGEDLRELQRPFYPERHDETKLFAKFDTHVQNVVSLGYLRHNKSSGRFEVRQIIKARIQAQDLAKLKNRLLSHREEEA